MNAFAMRHAHLPGKWFYERAVCDCGCQIITAGRKQLQRGEELFCTAHDRMVKAVRVEAATLAQQDILCESSPECETQNAI